MINVLLALLTIRKTQRLVVARFALREFYRKQTIAYISTQARSMGKIQIKISKQKVQLKNLVLQKKSTQTEQRNSNYGRKKIRLLIWTKVKFYSTKILFKLVKQKEGFETKIQALESPDFDKRAERYTRTKIRSEIAIENNCGKSEKKKTDEQANERTFAVCG